MKEIIENFIKKNKKFLNKKYDIVSILINNESQDNYFYIIRYNNGKIEKLFPIKMVEFMETIEKEKLFNKLKEKIISITVQIEGSEKMEISYNQYKLLKNAHGVDVIDKFVNENLK